MPKSIYLAGPEVFLPNAREILDLKAALTRAAGLIPVSPGDLEFPPTSSKWELGLAISAIDEKLMHQADAIIANLTPFRGLAADTGTCFELGFMCAQGFIDNLMLHGGIVSRGGAVVVGDAPKGAELTDMTAFKRILKIAAGILLR